MNLMNGFFLAFVITVGMILLLRRPAMRYQHVDVPQGHKTHEGEIPLTGGLAMFSGFVIASLVFLNLHPALYAGAVLLLLVGFMDDRKHIRVRIRGSLQVLAVLIMVYGGGLALNELGAMFYAGDHHTGIWAMPVTVVAAVGGINAFNMQDGADGLAGGLALVALVSLGVLAGLTGDLVLVQPVLVLAGAVLGFLVFNLRAPWRSNASVFMGDAGSFFLAFVLIWFMTAFSQGEARLMTPVTALWIFAVPLYDAVYVTLSRLLRGLLPLRPQRDHLHHLLLARGLSVERAAWSILALAALMAAAGIVAYLLKVPEWGLFYGFLLLFAAYCLLVSLAWRGLGEKPR